jgi:alpha-L-rhamnosidase
MGSSIFASPSTCRPASFVVHLSADNRYRFFVNGTPVCFGPARGDLFHWRSRRSTWPRISSRGRTWWPRSSGTSASETVGAGEPANGADRAGRLAREQAVNTDATWKVLQDEAYSPDGGGAPADQSVHGRGPGDRVDGNGVSVGLAGR